MGAEGFFGRLPPGEREALAQLGRRRRFDAGQVLFFEGDEGHDVFVLLEGLVKVVLRAPSGREVILDVVEADSLLGELSAIDGTTRSATVVALTGIEALVVDIDSFVAFLGTHPGAATEVLRSVAQRLRLASRRELEFGTSDSLARLCGCLVSMLERYGTEADGSTVMLPVSQQDLAAMTGLSREAVVKGLRALRDLDWIQTQGRNVTLVDLPALRARAQA